MTDEAMPRTALEVAIDGLMDALDLRGDGQTIRALFHIAAITEAAKAEALTEVALSAPAGLDVNRLSIAMNRAYTYGTGTAEQVAAEYAALTRSQEPT